MLSHPVDLFKAFLANKVDTTVKYSTDLQTTYMNLKGLLSNIRHYSRIYSAFKPFSLLEIINFIALIIFNGLVPSMRFEYKFKTQIEDHVASKIYTQQFLKRIQSVVGKSLNITFSKRSQGNSTIKENSI